MNQVCQRPFTVFLSSPFDQGLFGGECLFGIFDTTLGDS
jgi:hypothetical protein